MAETLTQFFQSLGLSNEAVIFIISMLPVVELRGGIIMAALLGMKWYVAVPLCILGNLLPLPFVLKFIRRFLDFLKKSKFLKRIIEWFENRTQNKGKNIQNGWLAGLILFVGIPLPGTGAWTGSLAADLFHIDFKKSMLAVVLGVLIAAAIVTVICYGFPAIASKVF